MPEVNLSGPCYPSLSSGPVYPRDTGLGPAVYVFTALPMFPLGTGSQTHKGIALTPQCSTTGKLNHLPLFSLFLYFSIHIRQENVDVMEKRMK